MRLAKLVEWNDENEQPNDYFAYMFSRTFLSFSLQTRWLAG